MMKHLKLMSTAFGRWHEQANRPYAPLSSRLCVWAMYLIAIPLMPLIMLAGWAYVFFYSLYYVFCTQEKELYGTCWFVIIVSVLIVGSALLGSPLGSGDSDGYRF